MSGTSPAVAVVTGGAGFLGSWVCERLVELGTHVVCLDNFCTGDPANVSHLKSTDRFELVERDLTQGLEAKDLPANGRIEWVLHLASPASPLDYLRLPVETLKVGSLGTMHALDLARQTGARCVYASTSEVYGDPLEHPQRETYWGNVNPNGPRSVYDEAKRFGEAMVSAYRREYGLDTAIARIFNTYGPRMRADDGRVVPTFIRQALDGEPMTVAGDGSQTRSICYVDDTVDGLLALASSDEPGPINIGNQEETSILELATRIQALTGSTSPIEFVDLPTDDPKIRCPDLSLAQQLLGWAPQVPCDVGLARTIEWFSSQRIELQPAPSAAAPRTR